MNPGDFYDWLLAEAAGEARAEQLTIGLVWTLCRSSGPNGGCAGLAMTPQSYSRTLTWPGTLAGTSLSDLAAGIRSREPFEAGVAMAAINASINAALPADFFAAEDRVELPAHGGNLAVFEHFLPRIKGARIVVVGRYPGMERFEQAYDIRVIERVPGANDYPDTAAGALLPEADWVFLTASSMINQTFPGLAGLCRNASVVLMGPSTPWLPGLAAWGIDYLAGTVVRDVPLLQRMVAEGGGRVIFDAAVQYVVADIGRSRMQSVKDEIAALAVRRDAIKLEMEAWYSSGRRGRFPQLPDYERILAALSALDTQYKWMWDARNPMLREE